MESRVNHVFCFLYRVTRCVESGFLGRDGPSEGESLLRHSTRWSGGRAFRTQTRPSEPPSPRASAHTPRTPAGPLPGAPPAPRPASGSQGRPRGPGPTGRLGLAAPPACLGHGTPVVAVEEGWRGGAGNARGHRASCWGAGDAALPHRRSVARTVPRLARSPALRGAGVRAARGQGTP